MSGAASTLLSVALLLFALSLHIAVLIAHPGPLQLAPGINSTTSSLNATNERRPYCRYEPDWYNPLHVDLDVVQCQDAIQFLIDEDVATYGSRIFRWSYPRWSSVDGPLTRANPRRYISDDCVLSVWMRVLAKDVDEMIETAAPRPIGSLDQDNADFKSLARQAYRIFDECVLGSGKSPISRGAAGWLPSGTGNGMVVALWGREGRMDGWLEDNEIEPHLHLPVANQSIVETT
ncbi:MAG: hypothetical protein OHK93_005925 [Ramalina farinacea]|uniref:Uncharacterized protein n=1 Tax=Ramalina farinacea TaxID=258253 RepID=A0AA43QLT6_9LECA|nr:hypothetical protein [Ramalina farinacea]